MSQRIGLRSSAALVSCWATMASRPTALSAATVGSIRGLHCGSSVRRTQAVRPDARPASNDVASAASSSPPSPPPMVTKQEARKIADSVLRDRHEPGWALHHATYTDEDLDSVRVVHKKLSGFGDRAAALMVGMMRFVFDVATRYPKHRERFPRVVGWEKTTVKVGLPKYEADASASASAPASGSTSSSDLPEEMPLGEMRKRGLCFGPDSWLLRIVFLESVAGVPGMAASSLRHLHSLRLLRRDKGWINTLLADAANERQHLLVALKLYEPGIVMRSLLLVTQGVFWNFFFGFYLVAPRVAHRFVGVLEEEAVVTYSRIIDDIQEGRLPEWEHHPAPQIAIDYWGLRADAKMLDVIRALRADEANHRYINHTLAELKPDDFNPFAYGDAPPVQRGATWGLTREEAIAYFEREDAKRRMVEQAVDDKQAEANVSSSSDASSSRHDDSSKIFPGRQGVPV